MTDSIVKDLLDQFPFQDDQFCIYTHRDCALHDTGVGHPEKISRIESIWKGLLNCQENLPIGVIEPDPIGFEKLSLVHSADYLKSLEVILKSSSGHFMSHDNPFSENSLLAIQAAAGCAYALGESLIKGGRGFALVRPPGHHAGKGAAEGFCFVNNICLAAEAILLKNNKAKIMIVDFDVHHGNGINDIYLENKNVFYFSIHGSPTNVYPGTGFESDVGMGKGEGYTKNISVPLHTSGEDWLNTFNQHLFAVADSFRPEYLLISAGFDAHEKDPFALMGVADDHYLRAIDSLVQVAGDYCNGSYGLVLEGGYSLEVLSKLVPLVVARLAR